MLKSFLFGIILIVGKCDDMRNNRGQALVEFILILPVFLMIILCMIDFGKIFYEKYALQNDLDLIPKYLPSFVYVSNISSILSPRIL